MAQRTISDAGGDWASTATWVEGAVPGTSDWVVATATSGNLTISSGSKRILYIDLTLYTGTLSITASGARIELSENGGTSIFNAGAYLDNLTTFVPGFIKVYQFSGSHTIVQVPGSPEIPMIESQSNVPNIILGSDIYCKVITTCDSMVNQVEFEYKIYITDKQSFGRTSVAYDDSKKYAEVVMIGENCSIEGSLTTPNVINNSLTIDTTGTCSFSNFVFLQTASESKNKFFKVLNGDIVGPLTTINTSNELNTSTISLGGFSSKLIICNDGPKITINLLDECSPDISFNPYTNFAFGFQYPVTSSTEVDIVGGTFSGSLDISSSAVDTYVVPSVSLDPAYTHSISKINGIGVLTNKPTLKSTVPGTQVNINLGSNTDSILSNVNLTDISVTGSSPLYAYESTLSNTSGVTLVEQGAGGGGGESAYTYVN